MPGPHRPERWREKTMRTGIEVLAGHAVIEARGRRRVREAVVAPLGGAGDALAGPARRLGCDVIACSGGWSPTVHLGSQTGRKPAWNEDAVAFLPADPGDGAAWAGAAGGARTLRECLATGAAAGAAAAARTGHGDGVSGIAPDVEEPPEDAGRPLFLVPHRRPPSRAPKQFVDLQLDVTAADIELAAREGYESVEHVKRYTALGFGTEQGKLGNVNGVAILARALGQDIAATGTTVFRPSYTPVTFGAVAGRDVGEFFDPERHTPMHGWHEDRHAVWEDVGRWKRPRYYPRDGESMRQAVDRECLAARDGVAILDASTLGKIDIQGADAHVFLDRIYTTGFRRLERRALPIRTHAARGRHDLRRRRHRPHRPNTATWCTRPPATPRRSSSGSNSGGRPSGPISTSSAHPSRTTGRRRRSSGRSRGTCCARSATTSTCPATHSASWTCGRDTWPACRRASSASVSAASCPSR